MRFMIMVRGNKDTEAGVFPEDKEGLIQVKSREEGIEWAKRFPSPHGAADGEIEIRHVRARGLRSERGDRAVPRALD